VALPALFRSSPFRSRSAPLVPDMVPVLSPGKHRHPGKGACFMEMASWLAGEKWSDHPQCTDPVLAELAREVNDHLDAEHRARIVPMIPDVIGTTSSDPRLPLQISRMAAIAVLRQDSPHEGLAVLALLHSEAALNVIAGRPVDQLSDDALAALDGHTDATKWARSFTGQVGRHRRTGTGSRADRRASAAAVRTSVAALAAAPRGQEELVTLLRQAIDLARAAAEFRPAPTTTRTRVA
jgi:hypothetical protein